MLAETDDQSAGEEIEEIEEGGFRRWIMNHDDSWLFIVPYISLAVILAIVLSLFWLVVVVAVHFGLELTRQHFIKPGLGGVLSRSLWELKFDIGLVLFGLVLGIYMELALGVVGLGHAARGGAMTATRFVILQRILRGVLLSLDDLAQVLRVVFRRGSNDDVDAGEALEEAAGKLEAEPVQSSWTGHWTLADKFQLGFTGICLLLIVIAPVITDLSVNDTLLILAEELHPLPNAD